MDFSAIKENFKLIITYNKLTFLFVAFVAMISVNAQTVTVFRNGSVLGQFSNADSIVFSEDPAVPISLSYEYVDLGLSVKWATCNLGSTTPEGSGEYFAWGETKPKTYYDWKSYKYCNGDTTSITKYCATSTYGITDAKTVLEASDDAAVVYLGGKWCMPKSAEILELKDNCTWHGLLKMG